VPEWNGCWPGFSGHSQTARCTSAEIDRQERKGVKPSDHAPVIASFYDERTGKA